MCWGGYCCACLVGDVEGGLRWRKENDRVMMLRDWLFAVRRAVSTLSVMRYLCGHCRQELWLEGVAVACSFAAWRNWAVAEWVTAEARRDAMSRGDGMYSLAAHSRRSGVSSCVLKLYFEALM